MDIQAYLILILGIFAGFYVQTIFGFSGSLIALPILLFKIQLPDAIAYISIFYMFSSVFLLRKEWKNIDRKIISQLSITTIIGVILGIITLNYTKPIFLKTGLGLFIIAYVGYVSLGKKKINLSKNGINICGIMAGFFSGIFSTGGPLHVVCLENAVKDVRTFRATMIGLSAVITLTRLPALAVTGILTITHFKMALFVFPFFVLSQFLGKLTYLRINEIFFKRILTVLLCISAILLMF